MTGLFGITSTGNCISTLYHGVDYHSHLGTKYGGLAYIDGNSDPVKKIHEIDNSQFKSKFQDLASVTDTRIAIGVISDRDPQPLTFVSKFGPFAVAVNGLIENRDDLKDEMIERGTNFAEVYQGDVNQADLIANLINRGDTITDGIMKMWDAIDGSVSILVMTPEGIIAARDKHGVSPLVIGSGDGMWAVASESSSFHNLGLKLYQYLRPGEIVSIKDSGFEILDRAKGKLKICAFLWIYTGFPTSSYEGINTEIVRERSGGLLARRDDVEADMVAGVPDSGTAHAVGYAMESGLPYRRVLMKYTPGYGRSYTPLTQEERDSVAKMKLIPNKATIEGNRIILCEDSIVRGTQLKNYTVTKMREAGAKEVHVRPACPPLMFPCKYMLSTRSKNELAARKAIEEIEGGATDDISEYLDPDSEKYSRMVEWIRKDLGLDSLRYQRIDDMIEAIGLPRDKLCLYCWSGEEITE